VPLSLNPCTFFGTGINRLDQGTASRKKPDIDVTEMDLERLREQAWKALVASNRSPRLFCYGNTLVRVVQKSDGAARLEDLTPERLRYELADAANWLRRNKAVPPPRDVVEDLLADPQSPLPILARLTTVPVFLPDGRLLKRGYDAPTGVLCFPCGDLQDIDVPEHPSADEVAASVELVRDFILGDFPFVGDADRAHALALFLEPYVALLKDGPSPIYVVSKPAPGTGGTLLVHVLLYPALGHWPSAVAAPTDQAEWRREIFAELRGGASYVFLDNITHLDSHTLASTLTGETSRQRLVGTSTAATVENKCLWVAVGNSPVLSDELRRRTVFIYLNAGQRPESRKDFNIRDLKGMVRDSRRILVGAALTIIRAWFRAGKPLAKVHFASFENWACIMGGILSVARVKGFLLNQDCHQDQTHGSPLVEFLDRWHENFGERTVGAKELMTLGYNPFAYKLDNGHSSAIQFGKWLLKLAGHQCGCYRIEQAGTNQRAKQYRLVREDSAFTESSSPVPVPSCTDSGLDS